MKDNFATNKAFHRKGQKHIDPKQNTRDIHDGIGGREIIENIGIRLVGERQVSTQSQHKTQQK
jgi:hypothetical protein